MIGHSVWEMVTGGLNPEFCWALTVSLLHSLWQGTILAAIVVLVCSKHSWLTVHQKFATTFAILLLIASTPLINFVWLANASSVPDSIKVARQQFADEGRFLPLFRLNAISFSKAEPIDQSPLIKSSLHEKARLANHLESDSRTALDQPPSKAVILASAPQQAKTPTTSYSWLVSGTIATTLIYVLGVIAMLVRILFGLKSQWHVSRFCQRLAIADTIPEPLRLAATNACRSLGRSLKTPVAAFQGEGAAMVIGLLRPVILINSSLVSGLTPIQLEQIIAHELAHVYRFDPLTQLIQRLTESVLFFHPAVWYVSRKASDLRELCCDEIVAERHCRIEYAKTLVQCASLSHFRHKRAASQFSLAAIGSNSGQLTTRIESLVLNSPAGHQTKTKPTGFHSIQNAFCALTLFGAIAMTAWLIGNKESSKATDSPSPTAAIQQTQATTKRTPKWKWKKVAYDQIKPTVFLFGGKDIELSKVPPEIEVNAMVDKANCKFAQWYFGDTSSNRVSLLIEVEGGAIGRVFLDSDRNRIIDDAEMLSQQTNREKTWLAELNAEVSENGEKIQVTRQIGITPKLSRRLNSKKRSSVRITTLGYAEGKIRTGGVETLVRRIDRDGNGLPNESSDQIWFDLDHDGEFNLLNERQNLKDFVNINDQRYSVRSDRLGQWLSLTPANQQGSIRFVFELADKDASLISLEGSLRDELGMLIAIRPSDKPIPVPTGRYCIESLVVEAKDAKGKKWRMTLSRGFDTGWFEVKTDQEHELKLLDSFEFSAKPVHRDNGWSQHLTQLEPSVHTSNGLVVTNFTNDAKKEFNNPNQSVDVQFEISQAGVVQPEPEKCESGFF